MPVAGRSGSPTCRLHEYKAMMPYMAASEYTIVTMSPITKRFIGNLIHGHFQEIKLARYELPFQSATHISALSDPIFQKRGVPKVHSLHPSPVHANSIPRMTRMTTLFISLITTLRSIDIGSYRSNPTPNVISPAANSNAPV